MKFLTVLARVASGIIFEITTLEEKN